MIDNSTEIIIEMFSINGISLILWFLYYDIKIIDLSKYDR